MAKSNTLVAIVGPTAVGKTKLGVSLAKTLQTEVISVDSLQCYKPGSIVTAKVEPDEADGIPHHLVDYLEAYEEPDDFVGRALTHIEILRRRAQTPVLVGGSTSLTIPLLEAVKCSMRVFVVLLASPGTIHEERIRARVHAMVDRGLLGELADLHRLEAQHLGAVPDFNRGVWKTIGYPELYPYLISNNGDARQQLLDEGIAAMARNSILYAREQRQWTQTTLVPFLHDSRIPITAVSVETSRDLDSAKVLGRFFRFVKSQSEPVLEPSSRL